MRTLVDIPDRQLADLAITCASKRISRAEAVRQAIATYIDQNKPSSLDAFGIWNGQQVDGLEYQEKMRAEW